MYNIYINKCKYAKLEGRDVYNIPSYSIEEEIDCNIYSVNSAIRQLQKVEDTSEAVYIVQKEDVRVGDLIDGKEVKYVSKVCLFNGVFMYAEVRC